MDLYQYFLDHTGRPIHKNVHYFPVYERHFRRYAGRPITLFEIGGGGGGSAQMWKRFFGPNARIVVMDINPACAAFGDEAVQVRIGDQADHGFLRAVVDEFGAPDIVIDDGSHQMADISATFSYLYRHTSPQGVYLVEDLHTAYWPEFGGGLRVANSFIERCKDLIDELNADNTRHAMPPTEITRSTASMHFYDSVVVFERGVTFDKRSIITGNATSY